jgi:hypothetical protein
VCNGSRLLAAAGLLDGRRATSHWSSIRGLQRSRPLVDWVRGQRYIQDGTLTTTAGVSSGIFGALRPVEQLAGAAEAERVGQELAYPGWSLHGPTEIRAQRWAPRDLAFLLAVGFPWWRPTVGVGLVEGVGELEVAAPFEVYANSFAPLYSDTRETPTRTTSVSAGHQGGVEVRGFEPLTSSVKWGCPRRPAGAAVEVRTSSGRGREGRERRRNRCLCGWCG